MDINRHCTMYVWWTSMNWVSFMSILGGFDGAHDAPRNFMPSAYRLCRMQCKANSKRKPTGESCIYIVLAEIEIGILCVCVCVSCNHETNRSVGIDHQAKLFCSLHSKRLEFCPNTLHIGACGNWFAFRCIIHYQLCVSHPEATKATKATEATDTTEK